MLTGCCLIKSDYAPHPTLNTHSPHFLCVWCLQNWAELMLGRCVYVYSHVFVQVPPIFSIHPHPLMQVLFFLSFLLSSPLLSLGAADTQLLKRPSLRGPPHPAGQVSVRVHALITHLFVCLHVHNMHVCPSILWGVTRSSLFHNSLPVYDSELDRNTYCRLPPSGWQ